MSEHTSTRRIPWLLLGGDAAALLAVTAAGFAAHDELQTAVWRMAATFLPLLLGWLLAGGALGCFDGAAWRPLRLLWAVSLAVPLAAWLRGLWLARPIPPVFVLVLGAFTALALGVWRLLYWFFGQRGK